MQEILEKLNSTDESERLYAVEDIASSDIPDAGLYLTERLEREDSQLVRDAIVFALKRLDCGSAYDALFRLFSSPDAYLRNAAVSVFATGGNDAIAYLSASLDHSDKEVRKLILDSMVEIGTTEAKLAIRAGLHDPAPNVRITAVEYLGRLKDRDSVEDMLALFQEQEEPMLRVSLIDAFLEIDDREALQKVLSILMPSEDERGIDPLYIAQLIRIIARIASEELLVRLLSLIDDIPIYAEDIISAITEISRRRSEFTNHGICKALMDIATADNVREDQRYKAAELLDRCKHLSSEELFGIGNLLITQGNSIAVAGLKLIARSGYPGAFERLKELRDSSEDELLREVCTELIDSINQGYPWK